MENDNEKMDLEKLVLLACDSVVNSVQESLDFDDNNNNNYSLNSNQDNNNNENNHKNSKMRGRIPQYVETTWYSEYNTRFKESVELLKKQNNIEEEMMNYLLSNNSNKGLTFLGRFPIHQITKSTPIEILEINVNPFNTAISLISLDQTFVSIYTGNKFSLLSDDNNNITIEYRFKNELLIPNIVGNLTNFTQILFNYLTEKEKKTIENIIKKKMLKIHKMVKIVIDLGLHLKFFFH